MYQNQTATFGDTFFTTVSFEDDLFYELSFDTEEHGSFESVIEVPANKIDMELVFPKTVYSTHLNPPNHNPKDYSYGLFTEK